MASFVEQATFIVKDESTAQINKINAALKKLFATANSLKSIKVDIKVNDRGIQKAIADINRLKSAMQGLHSTKVAITANTGGLAAAQKQLTQLRQQAARSITGPKIAPAKGMPWGYAPAPSRGPPLGGGGRRGGAATVAAADAGGTGSRGGRGWIATQIHSIFEGAIREAGRSGARYIARSAIEGANQAAVGEGKLALQQLKPRETRESRRAIAEVGEQQAKRPGGVLYNPAQRTSLFSELLGVTTGDIQAAKQLLPHVEELTRNSVLLGKSFEDAEADAIGYAKAVQQTGRGYTKKDTYDPATGTMIPKGSVVPEKMKEAFDYLQKLQPEIGKEMTGEFANRMIKYLGKEKYSISDRGLGAVMLMGEEYGTKAAVGYRQAVKQLGGYQVDKPQKAFQQRFGLDKNKDFQKMLQTDMPKAVATYIAPIADKLGLDMNIAEDANNLAKQLVSNSTAQESLGAALYRNAEVQRQLDRAEKRDPSKYREDTKDNLRTTMTGLNNAIQGIGGELIQATAPHIAPLMQDLSGAITKTSEAVKKGDWEAAGAEVKKGIEAAAPLVGGAALMKPLIGAALSTMAPMLAMRAVADPDKGVSALGGAAGALTGAAGDLSAAAGALALGGLGGAGGLAGFLRMLTPGGIAATTIAGVLAQTQSEGPGGAASQYANASPQERERLRLLANAQGELWNAQRAREDVEKLRGSERLTDKWKKLLEKERADKDAAVKKAQAEVDRLSQPGAREQTPSEKRAAEEEKQQKLDAAEKTAEALYEKQQLLAPRPREFPEAKEDPARVKYEKEQEQARERAAANQRKQQAEQVRKDNEQRRRDEKAGDRPTDKERGDWLEEQRKQAEKEMADRSVFPQGEVSIDNLEVGSANRITVPPQPERKAVATAGEVPAVIPPKTAEQKGLQTAGAGTDAVPKQAVTPTDIASQITGAAATAGAAIAAPIIAAGPMLGAGIGEQLSAASATFASTFASVGSQLAAAGQQLAAGGQQAAAAISSGASAAGSAYGAAAAAKISAAVANVSINVNHSGGGGGAGGSPGPVKEAN